MHSVLQLVRSMYPILFLLLDLNGFCIITFILSTIEQEL